MCFVILKLGGAAITRKDSFETLNDEALRQCVLQLKEALMKHKTLEESKNRSFKCVIVHGAGSFGHFQANISGVSKGDLKIDSVKWGFIETRQSVTTLNKIVVDMLISEGLHAVSISPFASGWYTNDKKLLHSPLIGIINALENGFIPVLHGDAVLDESQGCAILSGDVIVKKLAKELRPSLVVFLTNVEGVFDRPPEQPGAVLIKKIGVEKSGEWRILEPEGLKSSVSTKIMVHDTTGGMATKIEEAVEAAVLGIPVLIVKAGSKEAEMALEGRYPRIEEDQNLVNSEDWRGTLVIPQFKD